MNILIQILFWLPIFLVFHSYVLFPIILKILSKNKKNNQIVYSENEQLPFVSILMAVYNEELVIEKKIKSVLSSNYPKEKIEFLIGSDCSTDRTNEIVGNLAKSNNIIKFFPFNIRQGKPSIINQLFKKSTFEIIIITDANVMFDTNTIFELVKYYKDDTIGLVDSRMLNIGMKENGISKQESSYISREVKIKNNESNIWGTMIGPFGGCFSIRKKLFKPVPSNFLVDDFYINMCVFEQGYKAINNLKSIVYEDVSNNLKIEFKRKIRIATGNFQNLKKFKHLLLGFICIKSKKIAKSKYISNWGLGFCLLSHKVFRWITPFIIIFISIIGAFLLNQKIYLFLYLVFILSIVLSPLDLLLRKININISIIRFISYFYTMNLALFIGFWRFIKGVKSGIWQPTKRNQS